MPQSVVADDCGSDDLEIRGDLIILLGDDDSRASKAEVNDSGLYTESVAADEGLLDSLETFIHSTTPAPPNSDLEAATLGSRVSN
ncbi:hypothetical protein BJ875DRAFT_489458 [Amylocarpus encephaloides]|uniref:Uncharacterized protein n=1 Tax=Amylocarpus encephaloides TaxID=45428 RepID=A0A9P7Y9C8_9HELO|nr:hypothetical protein BJ875DRAFT_489458 [Amylocarpus encephaloides]